MEHIKLINDIEDKPFYIDNNSYYHAFNYNSRNFIKMLNEGIKSKFLLRQKGVGCNGLFYISLSKKEECFYSAYNLLLSNPAFIIDSKLKTIKTQNYIRKSKYPLSTCNSILPFRSSSYDDEYQRFLLVSPKRFKAIRYNLSNIENEETLNSKLWVLYHIIHDLEEQKNDLPVIDLNTNKELNRQKVLSLKYFK